MNRYKTVNLRNEEACKKILSLNLVDKVKIILSEFDKPLHHPRFFDENDPVVKLVEEELGVTDIYRMLYFYMPPGHHSGVHIDSQELPHNDQAVILPLTDCNNVFLRWFKPTDDDKTIITPPVHGRLTKLTMILYENTVEIDRRELNTATAVKINDFHDVCNLSDHPQEIISIRFKTGTNSDLKL